MKQLLTFLTASILLTSCLSTEHVVVDENSNNNYIYDFDSRLSQSKMRQLRANVGAIKFGAFMAAAVVDAATAPDQQECQDEHQRNHRHDRHYHEGTHLTEAVLAMPRVFKEFKIVNRSSERIMLDCIGDYPVDEKSVMSVRNIILPAGKTIRLTLGNGMEFRVFLRHDASGQAEEYSFVTGLQHKAVYDGRSLRVR